MTDEYKKNIDFVTRMIQPATVALVSIEHGVKLNHIGSGVLVASGSNLYILTAGHVLADSRFKDMYIPLVDNNFVRISEIGDTFYTYIPGQQDNMDAGVIKIGEIHLKYFNDFYQPLTRNDIQVEHDILSEDERYFVFGYPASRVKSKIDSITTVSAQPIRITTASIADKRMYEKFEFPMFTNILVRMQRKVKGKGPRRFIPKLHGISGCGMYYVPELWQSSNSPVQKLVGIVTDSDFSDGFCAAIRTDVFCKLINQIFNDDLCTSSLNLDFSIKK